MINIQISNININICQKFIILFFLNFQYFNIMIFCVVLHKDKIENVCQYDFFSKKKDARVEHV